MRNHVCIIYIVSPRATQAIVTSIAAGSSDPKAHQFAKRRLQIQFDCLHSGPLECYNGKARRNQT